MKKISTNKVLVATVALLLLTAVCGSKPKDVTNDPDFGDFKSVVGTWKTKVPLRLVEIEKKLYLDKAGQSFPGEKDLVDVSVGTEVRIQRLIFRHTFEVDFLDVIGDIAVGQYSGKSVNLSGSFFTPVDWPSGSSGSLGKVAPSMYYSTFHHPSYAKPNWIVAPDMLERIAPALAPK